MSFSSTIPSFITSFLPSLYCLHIKSRYSVVSSSQQCSHSPLGCFPTIIAYCLSCFKCPILTLLLYSALFCCFPFSSVSWSFFVLKKIFLPKLPFVCFSQLTERTPFIGWSSFWAANCFNWWGFDCSAQSRYKVLVPRSCQAQLVPTLLLINKLCSHCLYI